MKKTNVKPKARRQRRPVVEEIEPRILFSADFSPAVLDAHSVLPQAEQRILDAGGEFAASAAQTQATAPVQVVRHEVVFVDTAVPDYQKLVQDITANSNAQHQYDVVLLKPGADGIKQITQTLSGMHDVNAVHIVSHGSDGEVQLGGVTLNFDSLLKNASQIKGWGQALAPGADVLIYGCDVAQHADGKALVNALSRLTGADVAASDDLTGAADEGANWTLEYDTGHIETSLAISVQEQLDWRGTLQALAQGGETRANSTTGNTQMTNGSVQARTVAIDGSGNYVVVWSSNGQDGSGQGIYAQRYNAAGVAQGGEFRVNTTTANDQTDPAVAMDANGNFVVAWSGNGTGDSAGVFARRYNAAGTALDATEVRVNATTAGTQQSPLIAMNENGTYVIAWGSNGQDGSGQGVYAQRYSAAGVKQGSEFQVNVTTAGDQWADSIAMDGAGNFIVAFSSSDGNGLGAYTRRYNAAGTALTGEVQVNSTATGDQTWTTVAMNRSGAYVVAWSDTGADGSGSGIYAQRFDANGVAQGSEFRVNTTTAGDQVQPTVAIDASGNFTVVWSSFGQDVAGTWGVYKQDYNADGTPFGGETRVNTTTSGDQQHIGVAMNAVGQYVTVWDGNGPGDGTGVFFQRYVSGLVVDTTSDAADGTTTSIANLLAAKGGDGKISLREAILATNSSANVGGPDRIYFNIASSGVQTINAGSTGLGALPQITGAVAIDGTTERGFAGTPIVELNGTSAGAGASGLTLAAGSSGSTIEGLVINRFTQDGIRITGSSNNTIAGNFVGTNAAGSSIAGTGNLVGVDVISGSTNNTIGGTTAAARNIISGNTVDGIQIRNAGTMNNVVIGNYIGLDVTGAVDLGNTNQGIAIFSGATNNTVGGTAAGTRNIISGNNGEGVRLIGAGTSNNLVVGNYIGLNAAGTGAVGNGNDGVSVQGGATNNTIGGTTAAARNVISGNLDDGIEIKDAGTTGNTVLGNWIGLNPGGTAAIANADDGVVFSNGSTANTLGGLTASSANVISGNTDDGVFFTDSGTSGNLVEGNIIGLNPGATAAIANGGDGVKLQNSASANNIGASASGAGNVIAGNTGSGVHLLDDSDSNTIRGNWIGTNSGGVLNLGNGQYGVYVQGGATAASSPTTISVGGILTGEGNVIAFSALDGVAVSGAGSSGIAISGNAIYSNTKLGINLIGGSEGASGVTANDAVGTWTGTDRDPDSGPNALQNYPSLSGVVWDGTTLYVSGSLNSTGSSNYRIHVYASSAVDPSGNGEGQRYLGSFNVTTGANGNVLFTSQAVTPLASVSAGDWITVTATALSGPDRNTSEFSTAVQAANVNSAPVLSGANNLASVNEDAAGNAGTLVSALISGKVSDPDAGALSGVAVTAVVNANGTWQYSINGGGSWTSFGSPSNSSALLLAADANTYVRFVPNANWNGSVANGITFRAWDQTSGTAGSAADTSTNGGSTAFSSVTASASVTVSSVNDAPAGANNTVTTNEDTAYTFAAADFGFSDPNDSPANNLTAVKISTVPGAGSLTLSGVAVTAGQTVSVANINAGNLKFTPAANASGAGYASFTFQVQDDGGTANGGVDLDASPNTMTVNVTAVNDAPVNIVPAPQATSQNTSLAFSSSNGNQISIADVDAASGSLQITLTATNGVLTLNGVGGLTFTTGDGTADAIMTFTGTLANLNAALNGLTFAPTAGYNGAASLSLTTSDQGNTGVGGAQSANSTVNITVNTVAVPTATNDAYSVNEDSVVTVSTTWYDASWQYREQLSFNNASRAENLVNFPVLVAIDTTTFGLSFYSQTQPAGQDLRFVDANGTLLTHEIESWNPGGTSYVWVKVPQIDASSNSDSISMYWGNASAPDVQNAAAVWGNNYAGEWHFNGSVTDSTGLNTATDNGTNALVGQIAAGRDFNGGGAYVQTSSTALQSADSFTIGTWFNADATDYTHHLLWEGMNGANGFGDPGVPAANQEMNLSMGGVPALNTPTDNYLTFFLGDQDEPVDAGVLQISTPFVDTAGWHYVSVVVNNMSTAPSATMYLDGVAVGSDTGTVARTSRTGWDTAMRFGEPGMATRYYDGALDELNLATVARSANWVDAQYASMTGTLISNAAVEPRPVVGVLANDTNPAGSPLTAVLVSGPSNAASFTLNADGTFSYTPVADYNGTDTFTYLANDGTSTSNTATVTITVNPVNDAPAGANKTVTTLEDNSYTFATADFGFTDPSDSLANALLNVKITTLPGAGTLTDNGVAVTAGQVVTAADISGGKLIFTPTANASGASYASFTFQVQDDGGTANGGVDLDASPNTMTVNVTAVNDAPAGANNAVTTNEDSAYTFAAADFSLTDPSDTPVNSLLNVKITTLPSAGTLTDNGVAVTAGQFVTAADISGGLLAFTPAADANGVGYASFTFQVQDNGGTVNGGVDLDPTPNTITIDVTAVNDAPVLSGASNLTAVNEDPAANPGTLVSTLISGQTTDIDPAAPTGIAVTAVDNTNGAWQYSTNGGTTWNNFGAPTGAAARLLAADASTYVRFVPNANWNGSVPAGITFRAWDQSSGLAGGTANTTVNGGTTAFSSATASSSITVNPVNDAPAGANKTVTTNEDTAYSFTVADFGFSDAADAPPDALLNVKITTLPGAGSLTNNGVALSAGQSVTLADIAAGNLTFTPALNANGAGYSSFTFQVQDDGGIANGGVDLDPTPRTMTVNVTPVNDAPTAANGTVSTAEDTPHVFNVGDFNFSDVDAGDTLQSVTIVSLSGGGSLTLSGVGVSAGQVISAANISANNLVFTPAAGTSGASYASFDFSVSDGAASSSPVNVLTVDVGSLNDAPQGSPNTVTTLEDTAYAFKAVDFGFSDPNDSPANNLQAVEITTLPTAGTLTDNGVAVGAGQFVSVADIAGGKLVFAPAANANGNNYASFTFQVQDDGGTAGGGTDTDPTPHTITVDVTPVNDAPQGTSKTVTTSEDTAYTFTAADFGFGDPNDAPADSLAAVQITTLPGAGSLTDNGAAVAAGQFVSVSDITGGLLTFTPTANANGAAYTSFTFQVQDNGGIANGGVNVDTTPRTMIVDVAAINDAPVLGNNTLTIVQGGSVILSGANLSATDVDSPAAGLTFTVSNVLDGRFELVTGPGVAITNFTQGTITAGQVRFVHDGSTNPPAFNVTVDDGGSSVGPTATTISFSVPGGAVVAPPVSTPPPPAANPGGTPPAPPPPAQQNKQAPLAPIQVTTLSGGLPMAPEAVDNELMEPIRGTTPFLRLDARLPRSNLNPAPLLKPVEQTLLIEGSDPQSMQFGPVSKIDWSAQTAFPSADHSNSEHDQIKVIMESVRMGGIALSVGVVWWASRVTGLIGSLLASMPAWRQLDPLPIVGRDEDEERWYEPEDSEADADELAISMVLEGPRSRDAARV